MKSGLEYFPLDVHLDEKFELIEAEFGLTGFAVIVKLFQRIYGGQGYDCEWTNEVALLFGRFCGAGAGVVSEIVSAAVRRGIFDRELFERYHILTSVGIQKRYLEAVSRRKKVEVEKAYLLLKCAQISENVCISGENVNISSKNADILRQSKEEESKEKKSKYTKEQQHANARVRELFKALWDREPSPYELTAVQDLYRPLGGMNGDNCELLEEAMKWAALSGTEKLLYVQKCFQRYRERGIENNDGYWEYEIKRDTERGKI